MDNKTHVGLVYSHAESDGSHNHINAFHQKVVLRLRPRCAVQAGVIRLGLNVIGLQYGRKLFHLFARKAIDDAAFACMLPDEHDDVAFHLLRFGAHFVVEVGAIERAFKLLCIANAKTFLNVRAHFVGGRGRKGNHGGVSDTRNGWSDVAIFGAEVVSPLRNTVRLVYGIERNLDGLQKLHVLILTQRFGCNVQKLRCAALNVVHNLLNGGLVKRRVEVMGHATVFAHAVHHVHLVLHQGDEWRDNDGRSFHQERRQLVAQAFSATSGHQHKGVVTRKKVADNGLLVSFKRVETKVLF